MCGIAGGLAGVELSAMLAAIRHRGPDGTYEREVGRFALGAVRLAVQDLDERAASPMTVGAITLAYNGELWNVRELRAKLEDLGRTFRTTGDTEVVATALDAWGPDALPRMEGMFGLAWTDGEVLRIARDRFGEVPLHATRDGRFASEERALGAGAALIGPGEVWTFRDAWERTAWYAIPRRRWTGDREEAAQGLRAILEDACEERAISDVPACALLSGGIDSAAIAWGLRKVIPGLVTYTAVMDPASRDLRNARAVAGELGLELVEVRIPEPTPEDLARTVAAIEMPYKAQVEIGWPCIVLAQAIRSDGFRVTFSGEGSDELWASYKFAKMAYWQKAFTTIRRDLVATQARQNFPRVNKAFLSAGVEARLPFLHTRLVEYALALPEEVIRYGGQDKAIMSSAFRDVLPEEVLRRGKMAFQEGLGMREAAARAVAHPAGFYRTVYERRSS